jgi:zinc metalloprotease ZmpB
MEKLRASDDTRVTYDASNGAVRSFFGVDLVEPPAADVARGARSAGDTTQAFLDDNKDAFKLDRVALAPVSERRGSATTAVTYRQQHNGIPVYGAKVVIGVEQATSRVASAVNEMDYELPSDLSRDAVNVEADRAAELARQHLSQMFGEVKTGQPALYVYRCAPSAVPEVESDATRTKVERAEALGRGEPGKVYLAWQVLADTTEPRGNWEVFIDARSGELIQVKDRRRYASVKGLVFFPDPVTTSGNPALSSATAVATLVTEQREVDIENLDAPNGSTFRLNGRWVETRDIESPDFNVPTTDTDFRFGTADRRFLSVMAYFWIDRLIAHLQQFGIQTFNSAVDSNRIGVDAQGVGGEDNSHFTTDLNGRPYIAFGEGGVPDAADAHVVVHEFGHALHFFMDTNQNQKGSEEGFGDFLAGSWLDRFNTNQFQRESVFPWDNNLGDRYSNDRFFNTRRKFSDASFNGLPIHTKGSVLAATLWDLFLSLGGSSSNPDTRIAAADRIVHMYMEMLVSLADESSYLNIGRGLMHADAVLNGGANAAAIAAAFANRGLGLT